MPHNTVERIKENLSIVDVIESYVKLEKAGMHWKARCPFHNEKTPSFFVSPVRGSYYCFGCGAKGDMFTFVQEFEKVDFKAALRMLADRAGVPLESFQKKEDEPDTRLYDLMDKAASWFETHIAESKDAYEYLRKRGFEDTTIKAWRIGFAKDAWRDTRTYLRSLGYSDDELVTVGLIRKSDKGKEPYDWFRSRIMFPLFDVGGRVVAFSGRLFGKEEGEGLPKYINSPETPLFSKSRFLYGLHAAKFAVRKRGYAIFVEGQADLVLSHQAGFANTVATSGTSLTHEHVKEIKKLTDNIIFGFDADSAGVRATVRGAGLALSFSMDVKVANLPKGLDPADAVKTDPAIWARAIRDAVPFLSFYTNEIVSSVEDRGKRSRAVVSEVLPFVALLTRATDQSRAIADIAYKLGEREEALMRDLERISREEALWKIQGEESGLSKVKTSPETPLQKDSVYRRIASLILWQEGEKEPMFDVSAFKEDIRKNDPAIDEKITPFAGEKEKLIFEAERLYQNGIPHAEVALLSKIVRDERIKEEYERARRELVEAERIKDKVRAEKLLRECDRLMKELRSPPA